MTDGLPTVYWRSKKHSNSMFLIVDDDLAVCTSLKLLLKQACAG